MDDLIRRNPEQSDKRYCNGHFLCGRSYCAIREIAAETNDGILGTCDRHPQQAMGKARGAQEIDNSPQNTYSWKNEDCLHVESELSVGSDFQLEDYESKGNDGSRLSHCCFRYLPAGQSGQQPGNSCNRFGWGDGRLKWNSQLVLICMCLSLLCNTSVATSDTALFNYTVAVFTPLCETGAQLYRDTVSLGVASANLRLKQTNYQLVIHMLDSCSEAQVMERVVKVMTQSDYRAVIGPASYPLCSSTAHLAYHWHKPIIYWHCINDVPRTKTSLNSVARTIPSAYVSGEAMASVLKYFQWKRIAIFFTAEYPWVTISKDFYHVLTHQGLIVTHFVELSGTFNQSEATEHLGVIPGDTKVIVTLMSQVHLVTFLLGCDGTGVDRGQHALFVMNINSTSRNLDDFSTILNGNVSSRVLDAIFVVSVQSHSRINSAFQANYSKSAMYDADVSLYNALQLLSTAILETHQTHGHVTNGDLVANAMHNITYYGYHGDTKTGPEAQSIVYFSISDIDISKSQLLPVLEVTSMTDVVDVYNVSSIIWPNGIVLSPDTCDFETCVQTGFSSSYVAAILGALVAITGATAGITFLVRHRLSLKEMERGPNKIILNSDDIVFVSPKSLRKTSNSKTISQMHESFKSNSMFEKPDLLKASEPSLSVSSFGEQGDFSQTARYNGDLVFVKELKIKGFEIKGKVRNFLKQLRDLRHENVNPFLGCFVEPNRPSLIMEYCTRRSLEDVINNETIKLDWDFKLSLMTDLVRGMRYLHSSPVRVHGDLKSGNCVIDSRWVLKVTDYGVRGMYEKYQTTRDLKPKELLWTAPECLRGTEEGKANPKSDVFSFAIIMQEIVVRGHPYCMLELNPEEIIKKVKKPPPLCRPSVSQGAAPPQYIQIMKQCWAEMIDMRPDFESIHQQFKDINKGKKMNIVDTMFKMLEKYSTDLEEIVRERTVALEEEKKKTENLLTQMLPHSVAEALLIGKTVEPETFPEVTIYFSDIVGFTTISAMSTPMQVVDLLNDLYTMFDATIDDYDVYKVETIGDAYMCVSGLPVKNGNRHAGEIATMALDLLSQCGQFTIRHMPDIPMRLRIGLHSGSCVAGVVGLRMPRYCLFGDTVNTASRLESSGSAFRIHVSPFTKEVLDDLKGYFLKYRGEVELKGKGLAKTYWLTGKEGFNKPLPEPPEASGLKAYLKADMLKKVEELGKTARKKSSIRQQQQQLLQQEQLQQESMEQEQLHQEQLHQEQLHQEKLHQEQLHQEQLYQEQLHKEQHSTDRGWPLSKKESQDSLLRNVNKQNLTGKTKRHKGNVSKLPKDIPGKKKSSDNENDDSAFDNIESLLTALSPEEVVTTDTQITPCETPETPV